MWHLLKKSVMENFIFCAVAEAGLSNSKSKTYAKDIHSFEEIIILKKFHLNIKESDKILLIIY